MRSSARCARSTTDNAGGAGHTGCTMDRSALAFFAAGLMCASEVSSDIANKIEDTNQDDLEFLFRSLRSAAAGCIATGSDARHLMELLKLVHSACAKTFPLTAEKVAVLQGMLYDAQKLKTLSARVDKDGTLAVVKAAMRGSGAKPAETPDILGMSRETTIKAMRNALSLNLITDEPQAGETVFRATPLGKSLLG